MDFQAEVDKFVAKVNLTIREDYSKNYPSQTPRLVFAKNNSKYIKLLTDEGGSVWGFIAKTNGTFKGRPIKVGDLMKAAGWSSPAKGSRGNILEGTERWTIYGPSYNN